MKKKLTAILFATLICALCVFGFAACEKCEHEYGEWTVTTAATCENAGEQSRTCAKCGETEKESIAALGHDMQAVSGKAATCENEGWNAYEQCSRCDHNTKQVIEAHGHEYSESWVSDESGHWHACTHEGCQVKSNEATHGERDHYCSVCNYKMSDHEYGAASYSWSGDYRTCTATRYCSKCSADTEGQTQTATAESTANVTQDADCLNPELTTFTATFSESWASEQVADDIQTKDVLGHEFSKDWTTDGTNHWHVCTREGCEVKSDEAAHSEQNHHCSVCGLKMSEHEYGETRYVWYDDEAMEKACKAVRVCVNENCGEKAEGHTQMIGAVISSNVTQEADCLKPEMTTLTATFSESWAITQTLEIQTNDALGHKYNQDWTPDENTHWHACEHAGCEVKSEEAVHTFALNGEVVQCNVCDLTVGNAIAAMIGDGTQDSVNVTLNLASDADSEVFVAINSALQSAKEGSVNLTITGANQIPADAFENNAKIKNVTIGEGVTSIKSSAFYSCAALESVTIGDDVTTIGSSAFAFCDSITTVSIGENVTAIGGMAFGFCSSLESITVPDGVTVIEGYTFASCFALASVTIGQNVVSIGDNAFENCAIKNITLPNTLKTIGSQAFAFCSSLESITVPDGVETINKETFVDCISLTSVTLGSGVTTVGESAFKNVNTLTQITIPASVTEIGDRAFAECIALKSVTFSENSKLKSVGGFAFNRCIALASINLPDSVTEIGFMAFYKCTSLTSISIPSGITSIKDSVFSSCSGLESITIPANVTKIENNAFYDCEALKTVTFAEEWSTVGIGDHAFCGCISLTSINLPESLTSIGDSAFSYCSDLTSVTIPSFVTSIGGFTFFECSALKTVTFADNCALTTISENMFANNIALESVNFGANSAITIIDSCAFENCEALESITIPAGLNTIGKCAFKDCDSLTSITLPEGVTNVSEYLFKNCTALTNITFEGAITEFYYSALEGVTTSNIFLTIAIGQSNLVDTDGDGVWTEGDSPFTDPNGTFCNYTFNVVEGGQIIDDRWDYGSGGTIIF